MVAAMAGDQWSLPKVEQHRRRSVGAARCKRSKPAATIPFFDVTTGHWGPHRGKESSLIRPGSPAVTVLAVAAANATRTSVAKAEASRRKRCAQQGEPSRPPFLLCIAAHFFPHMTAWKSAAGLKTEGRPLANPVVREEGDDRAREKPFRAAPQLWGACCLAGRHLRAAAFLPWGNGDPPRFQYSTKSEWSLCSNQKIRTARGPLFRSGVVDLTAPSACAIRFSNHKAWKLAIWIYARLMRQ